MRTKKTLAAAFICLLALSPLQAQEKMWTLSECIDYALNENIQVRRAGVSTTIGEINLQQARDNRWPDLSASARESFGWQKETDGASGTTTFNGSNSTSLSLSSGVTLFSGFQAQNDIKKAGINYESLQYSTAETKEAVSLNIMNAYLQVLYAEEQVTNSTNQADATRKGLELASERLQLGAIANSDYLQVKTQLAGDELTLANAVSTLEMAKVTLMQLMELAVDEPFAVARPDIESIISTVVAADPAEVYETALRVKPVVKNASLAREAAIVDLDLARGAYWPTLSLSAGLSTNYMSAADAVTTGSQLNNNLAPSAGLSVSIPIFRNNQTKSSVAKARAYITTAELDETDTRNQLRKEIEQACLDTRSAAVSYEAAIRQHEAALESYNVAEEKYRLGAMNSVDFLLQKTTLTMAESSLLQSKYQMVYSSRIIDFYRGLPLTL